MIKKRRDNRIRKEDQHFTDDEWLIKKTLYDNRCAYCWMEGVELFRDHIIPVSRGGPDIDLNIVPACRSCNSKKKDNPPHVPFVILPLTPELTGRIICTIEGSGDEASSRDGKVAVGKPRPFFVGVTVRTFDEKKMTVVRCPACGYFLCKYKTERAEIEINCSNSRCKSTVLIKKDGGNVGVRILPHTETLRQA